MLTEDKEKEGGEHSHSHSTSVRSRNEMSPRKRDLPNSLNSRHQIPHETSIPDIPHLERPFASTDDLHLVVLEAGDGSLMSGECVLASESRRVPDLDRRVGGGGDEVVGRDAKETDEGAVTFESCKTGSVDEIPDFDGSAGEEREERERGKSASSTTTDGRGFSSE